MSETIIDLIRHGEPQGGPMYRGSTDDPLSELGWQQMRGAISALQPWQQIVSSPLLRCVEFAKETAMQNDIDLLIDEGLQEVGFGDWEGKTATQLEALDKEAFFCVS
jgi:broad specificity phosphatase PhoE